MNRQSNEIVVRNTGGGVSFGGLLFLLFLGLKLTGYIDWSWWWVTAPLWIPPLFVIAIIALVLLAVGIYVGGLYAFLGLVWVYEKLTNK